MRFYVPFDRRRNPRRAPSQGAPRLSSLQRTLVIDELGLAHAKARIDVAVINGCVHGFEIKSAVDTLTRLPQQLELYEECLEKLTIVCADKHIAGVRELAPRWCGITKATKGPRGAIVFTTVREPKRNPNIQAYRLAHLLWRSEAVAILTQTNASPKVLRAPRKTLYKSLRPGFRWRRSPRSSSNLCFTQEWRSHQSPA
ncbi:MAG: sce7726 family protein [Methylovirgula sp.]